MVPPDSVDHGIISGCPLKLKAKTVKQPDGGLIGGKNIGFYPVEATLCGGDRDGSTDCLHRIALMLVERVQLIPYLAGVKGMAQIAKGDCANNALGDMLPKKIEP